MIDILCPICRNIIDNNGLCNSCEIQYAVKDRILHIKTGVESPAEIAEEEFWKESIKNDSTTNAKKEIAHKRNEIAFFKETILELIPHVNSILEIGAGSGWLSCLLKKKYPDTEIITTDVSKSACEKIINMELYFNVKIDKLIITDAEVLPFPDKSIDIIVSYATLHHMDNLLSVMIELNRILKPNGLLISGGEISIPKWFKLLYETFSKKYHYQKGVNEKIYSFAEWNYFLLKTNFQEYIIQPAKNPLFRKNFFRTLYYSILTYLPNNLILSSVPTSIFIKAKK